jgi:uncharacterized protein YjiS (DUF1127 family)
VINQVRRHFTFEGDFLSASPGVKTMNQIYRLERPGSPRPEALARDLPAQTASWLRSAVDTIEIWAARTRSRRQLASFTPYQLKDIGLTKVDVIEEVSKPFWRA